MSERNNGSQLDLSIAGDIGQGLHHRVKFLARSLIEAEDMIHGRSDPDLRDAQVGQSLSKRGMLQDPLLDHVMLTDDHRPHLPAMGGNPEKSPALFRGHRPLPFGLIGMQGGVEEAHQQQAPKKEFESSFYPG